jgi:hypothetical protein
MILIVASIVSSVPGCPSSWRPAVEIQGDVAGKRNIDGFPFVKATLNNRGIKLPVERNGRYFEPEQIMDFYARYSKNGRRRPEPLGKDPVDALSRSKSTEADHAREQHGCFRSTYRKRLARTTPTATA